MSIDPPLHLNLASHLNIIFFHLPTVPKEQLLGITVKKNEDLSEWYTQAILKADLADYTSVSGCIVLKPYGYRIWELIQQEIDLQIKKRGVQNVAFPLLIPERLLMKESTHVAGFAPEVAWVTHGGNSKLDERLAIRPTSETIMYESFSKWIRSHRDLPFRTNQWNSVIRWEFKHPVPFLRTREFWWNEGHTCHATKEEAEREALDILHMYEHFLEEHMALPCLTGKKSKTETFAGAEYTMSCELFLPNGKAIQGPDSHHDGQIFSKAFDISFSNESGEKEFVYQNTWAITTRMIGVMILIHGDDKGLILPPPLAPYQIVITPILFEESKSKVLDAVNEITIALHNYRVHIDDRSEITPGRKFNEWELKGVPLRLEIGPKDVEKKQVIIVRRDNGEKVAVPMNELEKKVHDLLFSITHDLLKKAKSHLNKSIVHAKSFAEVLETLNNKQLPLISWCQSSDCETAMKEKCEGAKMLVIPFDSTPKGKCVHCGKKAEVEIYFGKSY